MTLRFLLIALAVVATGAETLTTAPDTTSASAGGSTIAVGQPGVISVLEGSTVWPTGSRVELAGPVRIAAGADFTIEAGVEIFAAPGASIIIDRASRFNVQGTLTQPIVFTCQNGESVPGCWEGFTILGNAPLNHGTATSPAGGRGGAGGCLQSVSGTDAYGGCNAADSSGVLRYVRVQYATHGLRLFGVGSGTVIEDVQVHRSLGNGLEVVGGTAAMRRLALTTNAQYGLSYRGGWTGTAQYVVIQQDATGYAGGLLGANAMSASANADAAPRSAPTIANVTIVAPVSALGNPYGSASPAALRFERGAAGDFYNVLLIEPAIAVDVDDVSTCQQATTSALRFQGVGITAPLASTDPDSDPSECASGGESGLIAGAITVTGAAAAAQLAAALDVVLPDLRAREGTVIALAQGVAPSASGFETVTFLGAVSGFGSSGSIPWYSGWTLGEQLAAPATVAVIGRLWSPGRGPLAGVAMRLTPSGRTAITDAEGDFSMLGVPVGPAQVSFDSGLPTDCTEVSVNGLSISAAVTADVRVECALPGDPTSLGSSLGVGALHTCGITAAGSAYCWGYNANGQLGDGTTANRQSAVAVSGGIQFASITANNHTCGITPLGSAYCWGSNSFGQVGDGSTVTRLTPRPVATQLQFVRISAGSLHTCAVTSAGSAYCWGRNTEMQLGDGSVVSSTAPVAVAGGLKFVDIVAGGNHTCALTSTGVAHCWGFNTNRQLGDGTNTSRATPTPVQSADRFMRVAVGQLHSCGLRSDGAAVCWGRNDYGQLGLGNTGGTSGPAVVVGNLRFAAIVSGGTHMCGQTTSRQSYCWGRNEGAAIGDGTIELRSSPTLVSDANGFAALAAGVGEVSCGVTSAGAAYCWGRNDFGQRGDAPITQSPAPIPVVGSMAFSQVSAGQLHSCAIRAVDGSAYCWGLGQNGILGDGSTLTRPVPVAVAGGLGFTSISVGAAHTCGIASSGDGYCWGSNSFGQLGEASTIQQRTSPSAVAGGLALSAIASGSFHSCALTTAGAAYCWGRNSNGQLGDGSTTNRLAPQPVLGGLSFVALSTQDSSTCALTSAGAAWCWGWNATGQLGDGTTTQRLVPSQVASGSYLAIAAGPNHTCALSTGGGTFCWGANFNGELGDGTAVNRSIPTIVSGASSFTQVAVGGAFSCAMTAAFERYCWGSNSFGRFGNGTTNSSLVPVASTVSAMLVSQSLGLQHGCGTIGSGEAYCWGTDASEQLGNGALWTPQAVGGGLTFRVP